MSEDIIVSYGKMKKQIKQLEDELSRIRPEVLVRIMDLKGDSDSPVQVPGLGTYNISLNKTWRYTDEVINMSTRLKELKATEEKEGKATYDEKLELRFTGE